VGATDVLLLPSSNPGNNVTTNVTNVTTISILPVHRVPCAAAAWNFTGRYCWSFGTVPPVSSAPMILAARCGPATPSSGSMRRTASSHQPATGALAPAHQPAAVDQTPAPGALPSDVSRFAVDQPPAPGASPPVLTNVGGLSSAPVLTPVADDFLLPPVLTTTGGLPSAPELTHAAGDFLLSSAPQIEDTAAPVPDCVVSVPDLLRFPLLLQHKICHQLLMQHRHTLVSKMDSKTIH
jgi:hypothetical protein